MWKQLHSINNLFLTIAFIDNNCVLYTMPCDNGVCWEERCDDNGDKCGDNNDEENCNTEGSCDCLIAVLCSFLLKVHKS